MVKALLSTLFYVSWLLLCSTWMVSCSNSSEWDAASFGSGKDITGLWKSRDAQSDKPRSLVAVYKYQNKYYGRMLATYDEDGQIKDTILEKKDKATGVVGHPPYCGMDFVYGITRENDNKYKGKIIDPEKGKVYNAEFWLDGSDLIVRGELWIFGKNIPWHKAFEKDLPEGFKMGEIGSFVPMIPQVL